MSSNHILGLDIGGTGIKGGIVDVKNGELVTERMKVLTPQPATPKAVGEAVGDFIKQFDYKGPIGIGFPSIVKNNVCLSASNITKDWIGVDLGKQFEKYTGHKCYAANDADVAGVCEIRFGAGRKLKGTVLLLTIGTGIGAALFRDGVLVPNLELGAMYMSNGLTTEKYASNKVRKDEGLSYVEWGHRFNEVLVYVERICSPNHFILGGGLSKKLDRFREYLDADMSIVPAEFQNAAGTIGAAMYAAEQG